MIKLVVCDMDGTLLKNDKTISDKTLKKFKSIQSNKVKVALASGRSANRLEIFANSLGLKEHNGLLIEGNGVGVVDYQDNTHKVISRMTRAEAKEIIDFLMPLNKEIIIMGAINAYIILRKGSSESLWINHMLPESRAGRQVNIVSSLDDVKEELNKICVWDYKDTIKKVNEQLNIFNDNYWHGLVTPSWLEITPLRISKGNALKYVMDKYQLKKDEVMCFGDGDNDVSMFKAVKYGIAMGNALASVKLECYAICEDNNHEGIVNFLNEKGVQ